MLFPTFDFLLFFTIVLIFNWALKPWPLIWRLFLLCASYYFYSTWNLKFLLILIFVSFVNFLTGILIGKNYLGKKKLYLAGALFFNLIVLGLFKYYDFFRESLEDLLAKLGFPVIFPMVRFILPLGLSFYIFRAISYNIDVYSEKIKFSQDILDFFIYISFFPHLLAGPITRAGDFLPQLKNGGAKKIENFYENLTLILLGLFKKLVISSYLATSFTDDVFAVPENHSFLILLMAVFAYSLVIYCDFSAYSDMAVGFAGMLGFKLPINFSFPYLATNLRDFWRRWHITLSNWARDYIYIPLGGNRKGRVRKYFNLMVAMLIVGLWHGASFHFIVWGIVHGIGLVITHFILELRKKESFPHCLIPTPPSSFFDRLKKFFSWVSIFIFVSFSWIFFRCETTKEGLIFIKTLFSFEKFVEPFKIYILFLIVFGILFVLSEQKIRNALIFIQEKLPFPLLILFVICFTILTLKLSPDTLPNFIYFNF